MIETLSFYQQRNNHQLTTWLEQIPQQQQTLVQAMRYGLLLGGKRIRPFLVYATGEMLGLTLAQLDAPACAIECIHAYSLIHDDLPAMDNDELRRGHPTCHIKFDHATAILAGDALQTLAFTILSNDALPISSARYQLKMIETLANASGVVGMCMGQAMDLDAENKKVSLAQLETIHRHKTGALIKAAVRLGAFAAGDSSREVLPHLERYAEAIGLAFQVQDDILDIVSDTSTLGKPQGSDQRLNKSTYPLLLGLDGAIKKSQSLLKEALQALELIPYNTQLLAEFARYVIERKN